MFTFNLRKFKKAVSCVGNFFTKKGNPDYAGVVNYERHTYCALGKLAYACGELDSKNESEACRQANDFLDKLRFYNLESHKYWNAAGINNVGTPLAFKRADDYILKFVEDNPEVFTIVK